MEKLGIAFITASIAVAVVELCVFFYYFVLEYLLLGLELKPVPYYYPILIGVQAILAAIGIFILTISRW